MFFEIKLSRCANGWTATITDHLGAPKEIHCFTLQSDLSQFITNMIRDHWEATS